VKGENDNNKNEEASAGRVKINSRALSHRALAALS